MITRSKLLSRPDDCGRRYSFLIKGKSEAPVDVNLKDKAVAHAPSSIQGFHQVHGGSRACTASLSIEGRACTVFVSPYSPVDTETAFPVYYLPWDSNRVFRMTLKPSKHQKLHREPDVFFTANLNGCMVTVEGPPDRPTVYHSNMADFLGSPALDLGIPDDLAKVYIDAKVLMMGKAYTLMSTQYDKMGEARKGLLDPRAITQDKYQVLLGRPGEDKALAEAMDLIARDKKIKYDEVSGKFECEESLGSVFGVRATTGMWSFYYQRLLLVSFHRKAGTLSEPKFICERLDWRCLTCDMFWPFGSGSIVV